MAWRPGPGPLGALLAGLAALATACGLSMSGLQQLGPEEDAGSDVSTTADASGSFDGQGAAEAHAEATAPACKTLDAACLGAVPAGWHPVGIGDAGCPAEFDAQTLLVNPRLGNGGCGCGPCQVVGSYTCGAVSVSGGDTCMDPTLVVAQPGMCTRASAQHIEGYPPAVLGSVSCFSASDAGSGVTTDPLTLCRPACSADYCGLPLRCIVSDGDHACPAGFKPYAKAGTGADPHCAPCSCEAGAPGPCTGTVTVYDNATCTGGGMQATYGLGTCSQFSTSSNYLSVLAQPLAPLVGCSPAAPTPGTGDAGLTGIETICCQ